jgi:hypothetical protein
MNFTSKQIVTMVVVLAAAAVLLPVSVGAATGSVSLVDPVNSGSKARVTGDGLLRVAATPRPAKQYNNASFHGGDVDVFPGGASTELYSVVGTNPNFSLTSLTLSNRPGGTAAEVWLVNYQSNSSTGDCVTRTGATFSVGERMRFEVPANQTVNITFPTPLTWTVFLKAGKKSCLDLELLSGGSNGVNVLANGFLNG